MIITATEIKNNLGKYLRLSAKEEVVITSNGRTVAKLISIEEIPEPQGKTEEVKERSASYEVTPHKMTYTEFMKFAENSEERYEFIDGDIYLLDTPTVFHQRVLGELFVQFHQWFKGQKCRPVLAPFDITLRRSPDDISLVQPDLMVLCDLEEKLDPKGYYRGVPTLVVEIVSESTHRKDLIKKMDLYLSTGVEEYWVANPLNREISVYHFKENNISQNATYKGKERAVSFHFGGLEVSLECVF